MIRQKICKILPFAVAGVCIVASIIGNDTVRVVYAEQVEASVTHSETSEEFEVQEEIEVELPPVEPVVEEEVEVVEETSFSVLTPMGGVNDGPSGSETYYNLNMDGVVWIMRNCGFSEEDYPYWVRDDGVKMLGDYVMVAADLSIRPRGSLVECSLGTAIVCDTGGFIYENPYHLDVAVDW